MNIKLYMLLQTLQKKYIEKYNIKSVEIILDEGFKETISVEFQHNEVQDKKDIVKEIVEDILNQLKDKGYKYKYHPLYPNAMHYSDIIQGEYIHNKNTIDRYSLLKD